MSKLGNVIISYEEIQAKAKEIASLIDDDYKGEPVTVIAILKGAVMWMSELIKHLDIDTRLEFMAVSSYGAASKTSGVVKILKDLDASIEGENVIIVEDIVDSGITLNYLKGYLEGMNPKSLRICTLLDKPSGRRIDIDVDYIGFTVSDVFIVGFGLDYNRKY